MLAIRDDATLRQQALVDEKALMEAAYEEQLGGVDSELLERRREHGGARSDPGATPLDGGPRPAPHV